MKGSKKIIIALVCLLLIILLIPFPARLKDGGSRQYTALLYQITDYHQINFDSPTGYVEGIGIKILGIEVFNSCKTKAENIKNSKPKFTIVDRTETEQISCDTAFEEFYRDSDCIYEFSVIKSQYVEVHYKEGTTENIKTALQNGRVKLSDLDEANIKYYKKTLEGKRVEANINGIQSVAVSKEKAVNIAFLYAQKQGDGDRHELIIPDSAKDNNTIELKSEADGKPYYAIVFKDLERKGGSNSAIGIDVDANNGEVLRIHQYK